MAGEETLAKAREKEFCAGRGLSLIVPRLCTYADYPPTYLRRLVALTALITKLSLSRQEDRSCKRPKRRHWFKCCATLEGPTLSIGSSRESPPIEAMSSKPIHRAHALQSPPQEHLPLPSSRPSVQASQRFPSIFELATKLFKSKPEARLAELEQHAKSEPRRTNGAREGRTHQTHESSESRDGGGKKAQPGPVQSDHQDEGGGEQTSC